MVFGWYKVLHAAHTAWAGFPRKARAGGVAQTRCVGCNVTGAREGTPGHTGAPAPEPTPQLPRRHRAGHNFMQCRGVGGWNAQGEGLGKVM